MNLTLGQRDLIVKMLVTPYVAAEDIRVPLERAISEYMQRQNLSPEKMKQYVSEALEFTPALRAFSAKNPNGFAHARGKLAEYLVAAEYNGLKNKGSVLYTFVNPDPTSKADLLHAVQTPSGIKIVAGPDVKTGDPAYVLKQYEKTCREKSNVPFIDVDGCLTDPQKIAKLSPCQKRKLEELKQKFPHKRPLPSKITPRVSGRILCDVSKYILYSNVMPSQAQNRRLRFSSPAVRDKVRQKVLNFQSPYPAKTWETFRKQSAMLFQSLDPANRDSVHASPHKSPSAAPVHHAPQKCPSVSVRQRSETKSTSEATPVAGSTKGGNAFLEVAKDIGKFLGVVMDGTLKVLEFVGDVCNTINTVQEVTQEFSRRRERPQSSGPVLHTPQEIHYNYNPTPVRGYTRTRNGKEENVRPYIRNRDKK